MPFLWALGFVVILAVAGWWSFTHPGTSREARHLEDVLREIPIGDMTQAGLQLLSEGSTPGEASNLGPVPPKDPTVWRRYRYSGEMTAVCEAARAQLVSAGWQDHSSSQMCDSIEGESSRASLSRECSSFTSYAKVDVYGPDVTYSEPNTASIRVSTSYPDAAEPAEYVDPLDRDRGITTTTTQAPHC